MEKKTSCLLCVLTALLLAVLYLWAALSLGALAVRVDRRTNLAAGTEGSVDFDIVPDAAGTVSGIITLNYEDASGNPQTISKDFSVSAEEMNMDDFNYDPSMDDVQPEQTGMPVWAWVLIGVCGAVVVIVVIVVVVRKRKKAKALAALEAEDSDEDL